MRQRTYVAVLLIVLVLSSRLSAETRFVTFGGGPTPASNQISLLSNAKYFNRVRELLGVGSAPYDLFFADGGKEKIVQTTVKEDERQETIDTLAMLLYNDEEA